MASASSSPSSSSSSSSSSSPSPSSFAPLYDCHCHLTFEEFNHDLPQVIARAQSALSPSLGGVISVSMSLHECPSLLSLARQHPSFVFPCAGIHPVAYTGMGEAQREKALAAVEPFFAEHHKELVGVGEIGLDYSPWIIGEEKKEADLIKEKQQQLFRLQLSQSLLYSLPANIHSRGAGKYAISVCEEMRLPPSSCLFHSFDGKASFALKACQLGYLFSVPPNIVRDEHMQKTFAALPIDNIVLETDSPALTPWKKEEINEEEGRKKRNEPTNITFSLKELARIKKIDAVQLSHILLANTQKLFPKVFSSPAQTSN